MKPSTPSGTPLIDELRGLYVQSEKLRKERVQLQLIEEEERRKTDYATGVSNAKQMIPEFEAIMRNYAGDGGQNYTITIRHMDPAIAMSSESTGYFDTIYHHFADAGLTMKRVDETVGGRDGSYYAYTGNRYNTFLNLNWN